MNFPNLADIPTADIDGCFDVDSNDEIAFLAMDDRLVLVVFVQLEFGFPFAGHGQFNRPEPAESANERQFEDPAELCFRFELPFVVLVHAHDAGNANGEINIDDEENSAFDTEDIENINDDAANTQAEIEVDFERDLQTEQSFESDGDFPRAVNLPLLSRFGATNVFFQLFPAHREIENGFAIFEIGESSEEIQLATDGCFLSGGCERIELETFDFLKEVADRGDQVLDLRHRFREREVRKNREVNLEFVFGIPLDDRIGAGRATMRFDLDEQRFKKEKIHDRFERGHDEVFLLGKCFTYFAVFFALRFFFLERLEIGVSPRLCSAGLPENAGSIFAPLGRASIRDALLGFFRLFL